MANKILIVLALVATIAVAQTCMTTCVAYNFKTGECTQWMTRCW